MFFFLLSWRCFTETHVRTIQTIGNIDKGYHRFLFTFAALGIRSTSRLLRYFCSISSIIGTQMFFIWLIVTYFISLRYIMQHISKKKNFVLFCLFSCFANWKLCNCSFEIKPKTQKRIFMVAGFFCVLQFHVNLRFQIQLRPDSRHWLGLQFQIRFKFFSSNLYKTVCFERKFCCNSSLSYTLKVPASQNASSI